MIKTMRRTTIGLLTALALSVPVTAALAPEADAAASIYQNCTKFNHKYPHGVAKSGARDKVRGSSKPVTSFKRSTTIYKKAMKANKGLDRDKDGVACEKR